MNKWFVIIASVSLGNGRFRDVHCLMSEDGQLTAILPDEYTSADIHSAIIRLTTREIDVD